MHKLLSVFFICLSISLRAQYVFQEADSFALQLDDYYENSNALALVIDESDYSDIAKLRVLYKWITENIIFNIRAIETSMGPSPDPVVTLEEGMATSYAYAILFDSVCNNLGIISEIVPVYTREEFNPRSSNHYVNAVFVNGQWLFVDVMSGSGYMEKVQRNNIVKKILKTPTINKLTVYIKQPNDNYFLSDTSIFVDYVPADPVWQLSFYPKSLNCYITDSNCHNEAGYYNYVDTIKMYNALREQDRNLAGANAINRYNHLNYYNLASVYSETGLTHYDNAVAMVTEAKKFIRQELNDAKYNLEEGAIYYKKAMQIDDSIYRARSYKFKSEYKTSSKFLKSIKKALNTKIASDAKYIDKMDKERTKIKESILIYRDKKQNIFWDDKIYTVERSKDFPDLEDSLFISQSIIDVDSLMNLVVLNADTLEQLLQNGFKMLYDSVCKLRDSMEEDLIENANILSAQRNCLIKNQPNTFIITDSLNTLAEMYFGRYIASTDAIDNIVKHGIRSQHQEVKLYLKIVETDVKAIKNLLVKIKKLSKQDMAEEDNANEVNEIILNLYSEYIEKMEEEIDFHRSQKEILKREKKILKHDIKEIDKTDRILTIYYRHNYELQKQRKTNEKENVKDYVKSITTAKNDCIKILGKMK